MDLIIQVNPPTFLCCFSHTWASEDDERWVGRMGKGETHREAQAIEEAPSSRVKPLEAFSKHESHRVSLTPQL